MFEKFYKMFVKVNLFINWITRDGLFKMKVGGNILLALYIGGGMILLHSKNDKINTMIAALIALGTLLIMQVGYFKYNKIVLPSFLIGDAITPQQLLSKFSLKSYIYGITIFSLISSVFIFGILFYGSLIFIGHPINLPWVAQNILLATSAVFTIIWFMYHILFNEKVKIGQVKVAIRLYVAIVTTLSTVIIWPLFQEAIKPLIVWLGLSYAWLAYITEKASTDLEMKYVLPNKNKTNSDVA